MFFKQVLLVGGRDFTLVGRPILPQDLVSVNATVIEKDLSHTKTIFFKRRRKQYMRMNCEWSNDVLKSFDFAGDLSIENCVFLFFFQFTGHR